MILVAGWDEAQLHALFLLYTSWAAEGGIALDRTHWISQFDAYCASNAWLPIVAWEDEAPIGSTIFLFQTNALDGKKYVYGDQAYFLPAYRSRGNFRRLVTGAATLLPLMDVDVIMAPVGIDGGPKATYTELGFKPYSILMRLEVK